MGAPMSKRRGRRRNPSSRQIRIRSRRKDGPNWRTAREIDACLWLASEGDTSIFKQAVAEVTRRAKAEIAQLRAQGY